MQHTQAARAPATPQMGQLGTGIGGLASQALTAVPGLGKFGGAIGSVMQQLLGSLGGGAKAGGGLLSLFGFAEGGHVSGAGTSTSDSIPAMLSNGEYVVNAGATAKHRGVLEAINSGKAPKFATGGIVSSANNFASSTSYAPTVHVNVASSGDRRQDNALGKMVAAEVAAVVNPPDRFRRSEGQQQAAAAAQLQTAGARNN